MILFVADVFRVKLFSECFLFSAAGISGRRDDFLYKRSGDEVVLPCNIDAPSFTCGIVHWLYIRYKSSFTKTKVIEGNVVKDSAGADRLSVNTDCSLVINNVTAEDFGRYTCRLGQSNNFEGSVYLSTLTSEYSLNFSLFFTFYSQVQSSSLSQLKI